MTLLGLRGKERARRELASVFTGILSRIEALETPPDTAFTPQQATEVRAMIALAIGAQVRSLDARFEGLDGGIESLEEKQKTLVFAVAEGIERTERAERRINATVARARKELRKQGFESSGLESEAVELRIVDGDGSAEGEVPTLPAGVEPPHETPSSVKGVPAATLARVRGY